jgi:hypothetical protein
MRESLVVAFALLCAMTADSHAVPIIDVGNYFLRQNTGIHQIPIYATGGPNDFLTSLNFVAMTGDGGPSTQLNVYTGAGIVLAPNITATIEASSSPFGPTLLTLLNAAPESDLLGGQEGTQTVALTADVKGAVSMNGTVLLGIISVDTNNFGGNYAALGTYHFDMGGVPNSDNNIDLDGMPLPSFYEDGSKANQFFNVTDGTITIVPEPSTFVLGIAAMAGLGFITLRKKYRRA